MLKKEVECLLRLNVRCDSVERAVFGELAAYRCDNITLLARDVGGTPATRAVLRVLHDLVGDDSQDVDTAPQVLAVGTVEAALALLDQKS